MPVSRMGGFNTTSLYRTASLLSVPVESFFAGLPGQGQSSSQPLSPDEHAFLVHFRNWQATPGYPAHRAFLSWLARALPPTIS